MSKADKTKLAYLKKGLTKEDFETLKKFMEKMSK
jgi:hypothetical protein